MNMKKIVVVVTIVGASLTMVLGQGQVLFQNTPPVDGQILTPSLVPLEPTDLGGEWKVGLWWAAGSGRPESALTFEPSSVTGIITLGYFVGGAVTLPLAGGSTVTLQVRVWQMAPTWEQAATWAYPAGAGYWGKGNLFDYTLGGGGQPPAPPGDMMGMKPIVLEMVPEPSVFAVAGLGLGSLLIFRRRQ